jgi:hypothetical protein
MDRLNSDRLEENRKAQQAGRNGNQDIIADEERYARSYDQCGIGYPPAVSLVVDFSLPTLLTREFA